MKANLKAGKSSFNAIILEASCGYGWVKLMLEEAVAPTPVLLLENPLDGAAWWAEVRGVARSRARLSDFTFTFHFHALEKAMATHSSVLAWKIPWAEEPGRLRSTGSLRVGHD